MQKKPRLGQNFLVDADAARAVVAALGDIREKPVVEIGPGRGALTGMLARSAALLTLIEYDAGLAASLAATYAERPAIQVRPADVLTFDLTALAQQQHDKLYVVGNLPYYITSDILLHLLAHSAAIDRAVLMVQREVAERITAAPGASEYGVLSATVQLYGEVELLFTLPPTAFAPPPDVHSSVFRLHIRPRFAELAVDPLRFVPFLRRCFAQKRKTLANNLRAAGYGAVPIQQALAAAELLPTIRAEAVDLPAMARVFHALAAQSVQPNA